MNIKTTSNCLKKMLLVPVIWSARWLGRSFPEFLIRIRCLVRFRKFFEKSANAQRKNLVYVVAYGYNPMDQVGR